MSIGKIERAAGQPGLRVARPSDVDAVIAGAEPVVAALADDQRGDARRPICPSGSPGRFALARILDFEAGVEIGLSRLGLDQDHIGHRQHDPADLAGSRRIAALLRDDASCRRRETKVRSKPARRTATEATSPSLSARPGNARSPAAVRLTPRPPVASAAIANATSTMVAAARRIRLRFCMVRGPNLAEKPGSRLGRATAAALEPDRADDDAAMATMIGISAMSRNSSPPFRRWMSLRNAACTSRSWRRIWTAFDAELLDRLGLLRRQGGGGLALVLAGQIGELGLGRLELLLEGLLFGAVAGLSLALDMVDDLERAGRGAAAAQPDQILATGQHVDRVGDEIAVVGQRRRRRSGRRNPGSAPRGGRRAGRCRRRRRH